MTKSRDPNKRANVTGKQLSSWLQMLDTSIAIGGTITDLYDCTGNVERELFTLWLSHLAEVRKGIELEEKATWLYSEADEPF